MPVSVNLQANTGPASKELESFGKRLTGIARQWESAFGGKGQRQAGQNLQQLSKGVAALGKQADAANDRLKRITQTLDQVTAKRKALEGSMGAVNLRDKDAYKLAADQERMLTRQHRTWQAIAATRSQMAQNAQAQASGTGGAAPGAPRLNRFGGHISEFAGTVGRGILGPLAAMGIGAAVGSVVVKSFREALDEQKGLADFVPRFRQGGALAGTNTYALGNRFRALGTPLGFRGDEVRTVMEAMSEGGSHIGRGLERDGRTAMQFGRMFGMDAGGTASTLASAQRMGAFKAGDAKRFAGMLAEQIARTGLGPRAAEVQEATMMLLNQQMHQLGSANPGPIMALQTMFNKTGIPGLTGMAGANTISRLQDAVTNPQSEASEALNFAVFRKMGAKSLYDVKYMQEEGLNNRRYLPELFKMVEGSAPSNEAADLALKEHTGLPLHMLKAFRGTLPGGRLSNFKSGNLKDIERILGTGGGKLEQGAAAAMQLPGNQFRELDARLHDAMVRAANATLMPKATELVREANKALKHLENVATHSKSTAQATGAMAEYFLGLKPGTFTKPIAAVEKGAAAAGKAFTDTHTLTEKDGWLVDQKGRKVGKAPRKPIMTFDVGPDGKINPDSGHFGPIPRHQGKRPPVLPGVNVAPSRPGHAKASFEAMDGDGYAGAQVDGNRHVTVTIREEGIVSDRSKAQVRQWLLETVDERQHDRVRSVPNSPNRRR